VDELNSFLGVLITRLPADGQFFPLCRQVQQQLFDLGTQAGDGGRPVQ
jgi:cob(I)alamin adenosyltransferase